MWSKHSLSSSGIRSCFAEETARAHSQAPGVSCSTEQILRELVACLGISAILAARHCSFLYKDHHHYTSWCTASNPRTIHYISHWRSPIGLAVTLTYACLRTPKVVHGQLHYRGIHQRNNVRQSYTADVGGVWGGTSIIVEHVTRRIFWCASWDRYRVWRRHVMTNRAWSFNRGFGDVLYRWYEIQHAKYAHSFARWANPFPAHCLVM